MAIALPWPMLFVSAFGMAGGVVLMTGKIGRTWRARWPLGIGSVVVSALLAMLAVLGAISKYETTRREEEARATAAAAERRRIDDLRASASGRIARAREALANAEQAVTDLNTQPMTAAANELAPLAELAPPPDGYTEVRTRIQELNARLNRGGGQRYLDEAASHADAGEWAEARTAMASASPYIAALGAEGADLQLRQTALQQRGTPFWAATAAIEQAQATLAADHADAIAAEAAYDSGLAALDAVQGDALQQNARQIRSLRSRLDGARRRNHRAAERLRRTRAVRAAQVQRCGARPILSAWDGELIGSESFVERTAHDPDSIDVENCTQPALALDTNHCWLSTCDVLGRNMFGAMIRNRMQFEVVDGRVISAR